ncbi:MAG: hypothetical protein SAK29_35760 [Scytonema sp. PMC 1069.18]|nr:hypothetical protein [Scytonema sp. PMC 1069.18]MEC4880997.1 hypothetical protein [Scytonema sp. PMC 1070.18]
MNAILCSISAFACCVSAIAAVSEIVTAQTVPDTSEPSTTITPVPEIQTQPTIAPTQNNPQPQPTTPQAQRICSFNTVDGLLPPPSSTQTNSPLSYLANQGFVETPDGSWACYARDNQKEGRYYTVFKVQAANGNLVATSFLEQGSLMEGQRDRTLDLFMTLIQHHTKTNPGNQQSIQRYLNSFISLVREGKIEPSRRGYLFDQPSRAFVLYHPLIGGEIQGTGITININSPQNLGSSPVS